jgi:hypothetical protein
MSDEFNEIDEIVENAENEWDNAKEKESVHLYQSAEKLFLLAIKKSGKPAPNIHARLAWLYYDMHFLHYGNEKNADVLKSQALNKASDQADIALKHDPENLTAQFIKTWVREDRIRDLGKFLLSGDFKKEIEKLIPLFHKSVNEKRINAISTLFWGEKLIYLAEFCEEKKLFGKNEIYSVISNIQVDNLDYSKVDPEKVEILKKDIRRIKMKAESRLM